MSGTKVETTVLYEAAQIQSTREKLSEAMNRMHGEMLDAQNDADHSLYEAAAIGFKYGVLRARLEAAEDALRAVLQHAAISLRCDESRAVIGYEPPEEE